MMSVATMALENSPCKSASQQQFFIRRRSYFSILLQQA